MRCRLSLPLALLLLAILPTAPPIFATEVTDRFTVGPGALPFLQIDQERDRIYTVIGSQLTIFDIHTREIVDQVGVHSRPRAIKFDASSDRILVSSWNGYLDIVQAETLLTQTVSLGDSDPSGIEVDPVSEDIYVVDRTHDRVQVVRDGSVDEVIPVGGNPLYASFDATHRRLWVPTLGGTGSAGDEEIYVIDADTATVIEVLPYAGARNVLVDEGHQRVFIPNYDHGWLSVYDSSSMEEVHRIWLREQSECCSNHMSIDQVRQRLFLRGGSVEVDLSTGIAAYTPLVPLAGDGGEVFLETGDLYQMNDDEITIVNSDRPVPTIMATPTTEAPNATSFLGAWWTNEEWSVELACLTTCDGIQYRVDGGIPATYSAPIVFTEEGDHLLEYRRIGTTEPFLGATYRIDRVAPDGIHAVTNYGSSYGYWGANSWLIVHECANVFGGDWPPTCMPQLIFESGWVSWDATPVVYGEGLHHVTTRAIDPAGNLSPSTDYELGSDWTPPNAIVETTPTGTPDDGWAAAWDVSIDCQDPPAGTNPGASGCAETEYRIDGGSWQLYQGPVHIDSPGEHAFEYHVFDNVRNMTSGTLTIRVDDSMPVDATAPETTIITSTVPAGKRIELTCTDPAVGSPPYASGCASTMYRATHQDSTQGPFVTYEGPVLLEADGEYEIEYFSNDVAGNAEPVNVDRVYVDTVAPTARMLLPSRWVSSSYVDTQLLARAEDPVGPGGRASGIARACFEIVMLDGDFTQPCLEPSRVFGGLWRGSMRLQEGIYSVTWAVWDGNENLTRTDPATVIVV